MFNSRVSPRLAYEPPSRRFQESSRHKSSGFSLLEVLIGLTVFSVGILGFAQVQVSNARLASESLQRFQANIIVQSMREQAMAEGAIQGSTEWQNQISSLLPGGRIEFEDRSGYTEVKLSWSRVPSQEDSFSMNTLISRVVKNEG